MPSSTSLIALSAPQSALHVQERPIRALKPAKRQTRTHSKKQIEQIAASIDAFGFNNPIIIDQTDTVLAGHGRLLAAKQLGRKTVPTIRIDHLSEAERRAYAIAENRLAELAGWDQDLLSLELRELEELDLSFDVEITGFELGELDELLLDSQAAGDPKLDEIPEVQDTPVSRPGDLWVLGPHRLICADARDALAYENLMQGERARVVFTDPPYNVPVNGHTGRKKDSGRREFLMASGEMSTAEFRQLLTESLGRMAEASVDGAIHYVFMDWRHSSDLLFAASQVYAEQKNLAVWVKDNIGMGHFYRSQHELVFVFKHGRAANLSNLGGEGGRCRSNVWCYPGVNTFREGREQELAMHPTVKPVALIADAIRDVSRRGDIVLDGFAGSGSMLIAADTTDRRARLIEIDAVYVDVICRRWQAHSDVPPVLQSSGKTFEQVAAERVLRNEDQANG